MADFNIRTDAVDVEQIMRQIRARIQSKRGVDYTEEQIQELANVKLERFLDPKGVRSDLVEQFKRARDRKLEPFQPRAVPASTPTMLYGSTAGFMRLVRKLLNPILSCCFNPNTLVQVLHKQSEINKLYEQQFHLRREKSQQRDEVDVLYYELVHNLVLELTRVGIENRNLKMRLESLSSRMDFDERRARALETVVQYRPGTGPAREPRASGRGRRRTIGRISSSRPSALAQAPAPVPSPVAQPPWPDGDRSRPDIRRLEHGAPAPPRRRGRRGGRGRTPGENMAARSAVRSLVAGRLADTAAWRSDGRSRARTKALTTDFDDGPAEAGYDRDDSGEEPDPSAQ